MTEALPHILVVDDDTRLRLLLRKYLIDNGYVVSIARDAAEARAQLVGMNFDLMVLDIMMPGETGLELTMALRRSSKIPILLLTARGEPDDRIGGLEAGADDYLAKPFEPRELVLRISSILRRLPQPPTPEPARSLRLGRWSYFPDRDELRSGDEILRLTTAEASLMRVLAAEPGVTFTREDLSKHASMDPFGRSVDVQVARLRRKIEDDPRQPRFLHTVRGEGYVLRPD